MTAAVAGPALSLTERARRYAAIRAGMAEHDIDVLLVVGRDGHAMRGDLRYVANYGVIVPFPHFAILPRADVEPVFVAPTRNRSRIAHESGWVREVRSGWQDLHGGMLDELDGFRNGGRVGVARFDNLPVPLYLRLIERYGADAVVDAAPILDAVRRIKSDEELECAREAGRIADAAYAFLREWTAPGRTDNELFAHLRRIEHERGSDYAMDNLATGGPGGVYAPTGYRFGYDDFVEGEMSPSWQGMHTQLPFDFAFGAAARRRARAKSVLEEAFAAGAAALRPGATVAAVHAAVADVIDRSGLPGGPDHFGHGLGLDVAEGFSILAGTDVVLEPGMLLVLHPIVLAPDRTRVLLGRTFAITLDGAEAMTRADVF